MRYLLLLLLIVSCKATKIDYNEQIMQVFSETKGIPYRYGGTDTRGFDCSGYANYVYDRVYGIDLPRTTELMWNYGERVRDKKEVGDLVFFSPSSTYNHVGVYIGNGDFIHSSSSKGIMRSSLTDGYWAKYYKQTRRVK